MRFPPCCCSCLAVHRVPARSHDAPAWPLALQHYMRGGYTTVTLYARRLHCNHQKADLTPCAVWHHSRPHRRLWTIPAVLDIYILRSPRSATQMCCPGSRLRSPAICRNLSRRDCVELTGDCVRSRRWSCGRCDSRTAKFSSR